MHAIVDQDLDFSPTTSCQLVYIYIYILYYIVVVVVVVAETVSLYEIQNTYYPALVSWVSKKV